MSQLDTSNVLGGTSNLLQEMPARVTSILEVDCSVVAHNYKFLQSQLPKAKCGAVIKADAYGLGMLKVAPVLHTNGCEDFFVATIDEAISLRKVLPKQNIYVFGGLMPGAEAEFLNYNLIPVLNDISQIQRWAACAREHQQQLSAVIHIDTGMWRLGLPPREVLQLVEEVQLLQFFDLKYFLSHLACSDSPHHDKNHQQITVFNEALSILPKTPASFANSHAIFLGQEYHYDLVRPGRSLYGLGARFLHTDGIRQAVKVYTRIIQVRAIGKGETVGYDAMYCVPKETRIATIAVGYADGLSRALSNHGRVYIAGYEAPMVGRVSMDLITVDVGKIPEALTVPGAWVEVIGDNISADDVALAAGTTSREIVSKLGARFHRIYK